MQRLSTLLGAALLFCCATPASAQWPQFLGPDRNGISPETGLLEAWGQGGPKELWRVKGGVGMSAVAVADGRAITMVQRDGKQVVLALDATTGDEKWATPVAPSFENGQGDGPRATPAITKEAVYALTGEGILVALAPDTGKPLWQQDAVADLGGQVADYGMACSPLVAGNLVVVTPGAPNAAVVAFDRASGKLAWKAGDGPAGYSSPAVLKVGGREQLVAFLGGAALGIDPAKGTVLWEHPYVTDYECNIATPLAVDGNVFLASGENHGCVLLSVEGNTPKEVWSSQGGQSVLRNEWQTSILLDGYLYGFDNVGSAGPVTHLTCVEAKTGKRMWQQLRFGKGNLIAADGTLFITMMKGELVVAKASPKAYTELGRKPVLDSTRQAPSLANGLLYVRDNQDIVCLDAKK